MQDSQNILLDYFHRELDYLRDRSQAFSKDYPKVASELALCKGRSSDPHVEMLIQSFAFLTGQLHYLLDNETSKIAKNALTILYPHLTAPIPSMSVVKADVLHDGTNFLNGYTLKRNSGIFTSALTDSGRKPVCRFRTCYDTELWPLEVVSSGFYPANQFEFLKNRPEVGSVLKVKIRNTGKEPIFEYPLSSIRFYINSESVFSYQLYNLLNRNLNAVAIAGDIRKVPEIINYNIDFKGFDESESLFPENKSVHPAYRLLQEYFLFPDKFMFFDVNGIDVSGASKELELFFLFDSASIKDLTLNKDSLLLNCIPVTNIFSANINPIALDYRNYEYRIIPDQEHYDYNEIYSITNMSAISPVGKPRNITSYFSQDANGYDDSYDYFWTYRQEISGVKSLPGTETYVSFHDCKFDLEKPVEDVISARVLCTNRRLPESIYAGHKMYPEGQGPVRSFEVLMQPTRHISPDNSDLRSWHLVSQLVLNHLSLGNGSESLKALKSLLNLYTADFMPVNRSQVDSIVRMETEKTIRQIGQDAWRGFCRGTEITITIDETVFQGGSPLLFGEVLNRFFALYVNVNSFTELVLKSKQQKGIWKRWKPVTGDQAVL